MEHILNSQQSIPGLLAGIIIILGFHLMAKIGEFLWSLVKKKAELSEKSIERLTVALKINTEAIHKLENKLTAIERDLAEVPKFKTDLRRLFAAVKYMAGTEWNEIRKVIMDDDISN
jgi:adenylate cyclase